MPKCKYFLRKIGGYSYGFKCKAYHNGAFQIYSNGKFIQYFHGRSEGGAEYNKEGRDQFVQEKCYTDCTQCTLYQAVTRDDNQKG